MSNLKYNKESIKNRMIRTAMNFWGIDNSENLDPLVKLLIEALSSEIYTLSDDVMNIEVRLLDKLSGILVPTTKTTALPSHAIMQTQPLDAEYMLTRESSVYYDNFIFNKKHKISNMFFSPVCDLKLKRGQVRYMIHSGNFYTINKDMEKEVLERTLCPNSAGSLWLALDMDKQIQSIKDLSFYLDFPNTENKNDYLRLLQFTAWAINDREIKTRQGINALEPDGKTPLMKTLGQYTAIHVISRDIYNLYSPRFITVEEDFKFTTERYPAQLSEIIGTSEILQGEFQMPLLWIHVQFPPVFLPEVMEDISISINAVPIAQKMLKHRTVKLDEFINIIPLPIKENDNFLGVHSVVDSHNRRYLDLSDKEETGWSEGTYSIRHGGCERFDSRDAKDYLMRLMDLLNEEAAMFTSVSRGRIEDMTQEMLQLINRMKSATSSMEEQREISHYLIMNCPSVYETITAGYWITTGSLSNHIKVGTPLVPVTGTEIDARATFLLTSTTGGKRPPSSTEKIRQFKTTLTSRERIITNEDIISFCMAEYPDIITCVEVKHGIAIGKKPREGLIRTIDVHICTDGQSKEDINKKELNWNIDTKLRSRSPETFNYRIIIQ